MSKNSLGLRVKLLGGRGYKIENPKMIFSVYKITRYCVLYVPIWQRIFLIFQNPQRRNYSHISLLVRFQLKQHFAFFQIGPNMKLSAQITKVYF